MRAAVFEAFQAPLEIAQVPDPEPQPHGVVVEVRSTGVCRIEWHAWMGHDDTVSLPHVPGHEMAGVVVAVDLRPDKLALARELGASDVIGARLQDPVAAMHALTDGTRTSRWMRSAQRSPAARRSAACEGAGGACRSAC